MYFLSRFALAFTLIVALTALLASPALADQKIGVQTHLLNTNITDAERISQLERADQAGVDIIRVNFGWSTLESQGKGQYSAWYLADLDHLLREASARGIEVLLTFANSPCWASSAPPDVKQDCDGAWWERRVDRYPPTDPQDYADALAYMVRNYGDRVKYWEVWNEPNHPDYFISDNPAADYARILKAAYPRAKAVRPDVTIIGGSLAGADYEFTRQLYQQGIKGYMDAYAIHPYSEDHAPRDPWLDEWMHLSPVNGVPAVRYVMAVENADTVPIWLTEFGYSTCTVRGTPQHYNNCVDEATQAKWVQEMYELMREWPYVDAGFWFKLKDTSSDKTDRTDNYGLVTYDNQLKPAFFELQRIVAENSQPISIVRYSPTDDATIERDTPGRNYGSTATLRADSDPREESLVRFNPPDDKQIVGAYLRLWNIVGAPVASYVTRTPAGWSEGTVTWNTAPGGEAGTGRYMDALAGTRAGHYYYVNVTDLMRGGNPISFRVLTGNASGSDYNSKEASERPPKLVMHLR